MIVGFNHNVSYRGVGFHVQTEDSGVKSPQLITLLYHGGTIISSQKTVYADILKVDNLDQVVEELAKEQHKGMLRRLTKGEFDQRIIDLGIPLSPSSGAPAKPGETPPPAAEPVKTDPEIPVAEADAEKEVPEPSEEAVPLATQPPPEPVELPREQPVASETPPAVAPDPFGADPEVTVVEEPIVDKFRKPKTPAEMTLEELIYAYLTAADN